MVPIPSATTEKFDIHYYPLKLRNTQDRIPKETFSERDRKLLLSFGDFITANGVSIGRVTKYLNHLLVIRRKMHCDFEALDRKKVEELMAWVNNSDYKAWTKADMKRALKWVRCGTLDKEQPFPPEVSWVRTTLKRNELEEPTVLNSEEVEAMISVAHRIRDKAILAVLLEGGFRIGELLGIKMKDIVFDEYGARVSVKGKTGARTVRLVTSAPILAR
jgi:integrase